MEDVPDHKRQLGTCLRHTRIQDTYAELSHRASEHRISHLQPRHRHWVWFPVLPGWKTPYLTIVVTFLRIFATPSVILRSSGSVGLSLVMWLLGATVALCGTAVYIELGTVRISPPSRERARTCVDGSP